MQILAELWWAVRAVTLLVFIGFDVYKKKIGIILFIILMILSINSMGQGPDKIMLGKSPQQVYKEYRGEIKSIDRTPEDNLLYITTESDCARNVFLFNERFVCVTMVTVPYTNTEVDWYTNRFNEQGMRVYGEFNGWLIFKEDKTLYVKQRKENDSGAIFYEITSSKQEM